MSANDVWAMDFVHDQLTTGKKLRILTVVDTFTRVSPVIDALTSATATEARTSWRPWRGLAGRWAIPRPLGWITAASSSRVTWIYGLINEA